MVEIKLQVQDATITYGKRVIFEHLTLPPLRGGKVVGLLGPNASGKSTLIKTITGIHPLPRGSIDLHVDRELLTLARRRKNCGYVPQDLPTNANLTAFETVLVAARRQCPNPVEQAAAVFDELQITNLAHRYLAQLSGGQRQLVAAAQMLVAQTPVMLLDEPTSALDLHHQLFLLQRLRRRARRDGTLVIVALHDINLASRYCDEMLMISAGKLHRHGSPTAVVTTSVIKDVYRVDADIVKYRDTPLMTPTRPLDEHPTGAENDQQTDVQRTETKVEQGADSH